MRLKDVPELLCFDADHAKNTPYTSIWDGCTYATVFANENVTPFNAIKIKSKKDIVKYCRRKKANLYYCDERLKYYYLIYPNYDEDLIHKQPILRAILNYENK